MGPIVVIGGFLSYARAYRGMQQELSAHTGQSVSIAEIPGYEWLLAVSRLGWARLLAGIDLAVQQAARSAPGVKITLVGHSAGGVLAPGISAGRTTDIKRSVGRETPGGMG